MARSSCGQINRWAIASRAGNSWVVSVSVGGLPKGLENYVPVPGAIAQKKPARFAGQGNKSSN
ncbi:hypothetical protein H6G72_23865 [Planktothricoides sp. FACHB-1370]|uniref:Uncharacterized protein n=2 Tax=Planktothricoides raciborskii TaxID=132608 RepID=A0AAU8JIH5_9CYAN|nr:hypothetical protein [Planktothricoides raciborskii FACHB-1370]